MSRDIFVDAVGYFSDDILEEAEKYRAKSDKLKSEAGRKKQAVIKIDVIAACICLVLLVGVLGVVHLMKDPTDKIIVNEDKNVSIIESMDIKVCSIEGYSQDDSRLIKDDSFLEDVGYLTFTNELANREKQYSFLGVDFNLKYAYSVRRDFASYTEDVYMSSDGKMVYFKQDSDEMTMVASVLEGIPQNIMDNPKKEEDYRKIAEKILSPYVNIEGYKYSCMTNSPVRENVDGTTAGYVDGSDGFIEDAGGNAIYYMIYSRIYRGIPTSEQAVVALDKSGSIVAIMLNSIGDFTDEVLTIDEMLINIAVENKALSLVADGKSCRCEIQSKLLCKKDDIRYIVISVNLYIKDDSGVENKVPYMLAVLLDATRMTKGNEKEDVVYRYKLNEDQEDIYILPDGGLGKKENGELIPMEKEEVPAKINEIVITEDMGVVVPEEEWER